MKDKKYKVLKKIVIEKGEFLDNYSNECKENYMFETVKGLDKGHVIMPKFSETDIEEMLITGHIKEVK